MAVLAEKVMIYSCDSSDLVEMDRVKVEYHIKMIYNFSCILFRQVFNYTVLPWPWPVFSPKAQASNGIGIETNLNPFNWVIYAFILGISANLWPKKYMNKEAKNFLDECHS